MKDGVTDAKAVVRRFLDAMAANDDTTIEALLTDDVRWWVPPSAVSRGLARPLVGKRDVTLLASGNWTQAFRPGTTTWDIIHMIAEGDLVSSVMTRRSIGANGAAYDNEYNWSFRLVDGRIAEVWEVLDTAWAFDILGRDPVPHPDAAV